MNAYLEEWLKKIGRKNLAWKQCRLYFHVKSNIHYEYLSGKQNVNDTFYKCMIKIQALRFSQRWLWRMSSSGMLPGVALVWTDVSEELIASVINVTRVCPATSQKTALFRATAVKTSTLT
jgi:hypothetical protein